VAARAARDKLAAESGARGLDTRIASPPGGLPYLAVRNRAVPDPAESIHADAGFLWSWGLAGRIGPVADVAAAGGIIARVLAVMPDIPQA
jgi:hypothetical protein